jgi:hypothetical protein
MLKLGVLFNAASVLLGIDVGHRLGLFDLAASVGPATSEQLAEAGGLSERELGE